MADVSSSLPVRDLSDGADGAAAPTVAQAVGGVDGSGNLQTILVDTAGKQEIKRVANGGGVQGAITVGTTAVLLNVSGTNLTNRVIVTLHNNSVVYWFWGYTNTVTTSTGTPLAPSQPWIWDVGPNTNIYVIAATSSNNGRVTEAAA